MSRLRCSRPDDEKKEVRRHSEAGDTLIEVLLALTILGIAGIALITGFATSITASAQHRNLATQNTSLRAATDEVTAFLQQYSNEIFSCSDQVPPWDPTSSLNQDWTNFVGANPGFTISDTPSVEYWNGSTFQNGTCSTTNAIPQPQQWTVTITDGGVSTSASTVVYYNGPPTSNPGDCGRPAGNIPAGCHLVFLQAPTSGIVERRPESSACRGD